jgi:flagellar biosynthetic protein FliP
MKHFIGHYVEMVLAMFVGMGLLALPWMLIWPDLGDHPVADTLVMAANMTIGMAAWMALRGHGRRMIVEMSAAMVAPFLLLVPLVAGAITADTLMMAGHVLMFLTMLAAMLLRRQDYMHHHGTLPWRKRVTAVAAR